MASEISVERQFRFTCSCGATMVTGERTVTCDACGITLGVRRVRRHRQHRKDAVLYYGSTSPRNLRPVPTTSIPRLPASPGWTLPVHRVEKQVVKSPGALLEKGVRVKVGPTRPDGKPHPHAGETGRITKLSASYPNWHVPPCAAVKLDSGIWFGRFIWVSLQCLEVLPEEKRSEGS
jgi:hypothetical protein